MGEKCHRDVSNILLQVLEEGHLTDNKGRKIDFRNSIIIMISNLSSDTFAQHENAHIEEVPSYIKSEVLNEASFSPQFYNRIDDIIVCNRLGKKSLESILTNFCCCGDLDLKA
jgi:ATP-dependent Clp protease ATP-binding subunit ClpB